MAECMQPTEPAGINACGTQTATVYIRATPMRPKTEFARLMAPNGAAGS